MNLGPPSRADWTREALSIIEGGICVCETVGVEVDDLNTEGSFLGRWKKGEKYLGRKRRGGE